MDYVANGDLQIQHIFKTLGITSIEELLQDIPAALRLPTPTHSLKLSESEGLALMESLAAKNTFVSFDSYLGAGAYSHYIPAIVNAITSKSAFLTAYTPYQAEISQGILQATFEFQSAICALTGLEVACASLYDGASACAEAVLMAMRVTGHYKAIISKNVHPSYKQVIRQYLSGIQAECVEAGIDDMEKLIDENTAAILIQSPNFLGVFEESSSIVDYAHAKGALFILAANPLVYGAFKSAEQQHADIAVGDLQPLGLALNFGGPYAGYLCCNKQHVRQLPGRLIGETVDVEGKRGFSIVLQTREQHIRREKATSNICTNQALCTLASLIFIAWYGPEGLKELSLTNYRRAGYLKDRLIQIPGVTLLNTGPHFNEFAVRFPKEETAVQEHFRRHHIEPGLALSAYDPELKNCFLVAVTETKTADALDRYLQVARGYFI